MKLVKIKNTEYIVHFPLNSLVRMEVETGKVFNDVLKDGYFVSLKNLVDIYYYGLMAKQEAITKTQVGDILTDAIQDGISLQELVSIVTGELVVSLGFGKDKQVEEKNE